MVLLFPNFLRRIIPRLRFSTQVVGLIIGAVPQLRRALIGDSAPLHVVQDSASSHAIAIAFDISLMLMAKSIPLEEPEI
ncbi:hypothetical protein VNO78_20118 [Psophocarpus tetragonolobus]|uniref:Uncharacterized protein n=1 Tax=Psophocarpus tetragonolobus TaxID=3891 RepID=A0AAN9S8T8_PSOTE